MHFTKYFLLLLHIRTFAYCFCPPQSTSLSLPWCVQGIATPKEKHRGKKGSRDQKTVFASFEFCFFVVRRQWTGLAGPIWQRCIRSLCAGGPGQAAWAGRKWSERTPRGAFCVWRHNQQYFECFLCKVRRFFLSVSLPVPVVFRLLFLQSDAECGTAAIFGACFNDSRSSFVNFWSTLLGAVCKLHTC